MNYSNDNLVIIEGVKKYYPILKGFLLRSIEWVKAVDGVNLNIRRGETLGLVGESGCGKTTLGRVILRIEDPTEGAVYFEGQNILNYDRKRLISIRRAMQIIFQDPYSSLDPRKTVGSLVGEPFIIHKISSKAERDERILQLVKDVGLRPEDLKRYPHEFSGGQRQRIAIARALSLNPKLVVCDEPVSALDVSIQAQVINVLQDLQEQYKLSYLFISHDLSCVAHISNRVAVMYLGQIVEIAERDELFQSPLHPYTRALVSASPSPTRSHRGRGMILEGEIPNPINPPSGCYFHTRCPKAMKQCSIERPNLVPVTKTHQVRCLHF